MFDTPLFPNNFPIFVRLDSRKDEEGKKKNIRISASIFNYIKNDLDWRNLITRFGNDVEIEGKKSFESVAR